LTMAETFQPAQWQGTCYDDGTGRNVYFVDTSGQRQRKVPDNYVPDLFADGAKKYFYRGSCLRCRAVSPAVFLVHSTHSDSTYSGCIGYSPNLCHACLTLSLSDSSTTVTSLRGRGNRLWEANIDVPRHFHADLEGPAVAPDREAVMLQRGREARYYVRMQVKARRNEERAEAVRQRAQDFGVLQGQHISWGFDAFDEYFGAVDERGRPHGLGVKVYSDDSVYVGQWQHGLRHTSTKTALWTRPDNLVYEGSWVEGFKHGRGTQTFPDTSRYKGEFAKGYEHGHGTRHEADGSVFEGRFRFGKKDGPGTLTLTDRSVEKRVFKEAHVFHEKPLPPVEEQHFNDEQSRQYFEAESLLSLCTAQLARTMHSQRSLVPSALLHRRLPEFMKPLMGSRYLSTIHPKGSQDFLHAAPTIAFKSAESIDLRGMRFLHLVGCRPSPPRPN